jgi:hypothetical protein
MNPLRRRTCAALACAMLAPAMAKEAFRTIAWDDLLPQDWNPWVDFRGAGAGVDLRRLPDDDPRAAAALQRLRKVWDDAPLVAALDGAAIRIPGYVVPLETTAQGLRELLLVPHFGACIHTPPPPSNQIVHVRLDKPHKSLGTMDTVWISGRLQLARASTAHGVSGYALAGQRVERYAGAPR